MDRVSHAESVQTEALLQELLEEVRRLKADYRALQAENERLKTILHDKTTVAMGDLFQQSTNEHLAMRQQIMTLISKIDQHLGEQTR